MPVGQAGIELGSRPTKTYLVEHSEHGLAVVEMFDARFGDAIGEVVSTVDALMCIRHPNLAAVHWAGRIDSGVAVTCEYVEGESLADLIRASNGALPLEIRLRVLVDVLAGLAALHAADLSMGTLGPASIVVGTDGIARIVGVYRAPLGSRAVPSSEKRMLAPEIELGHDPAPASDAFSIGVMLWEALAKRTLHNARNAAAPPVPTDKPWAESLCALAARALVVDPTKRPTASEIAAQIRLVARSKLATPQKVSANVLDFASEHVAARRARLAQSSGKIPVARIATPFEADTNPHGRTVAPANDALFSEEPEPETTPRLRPVPTPAEMVVPKTETAPPPPEPPRPVLVSTGSHVLPPPRRSLVPWLAAAAIAVAVAILLVVIALRPHDRATAVVPVVQPGSPGIATSPPPPPKANPLPSVTTTGSAPSPAATTTETPSKSRKKPVLRRPGQYDPASI